MAIAHTLWNDNRRYAFDARPETIDLGIRLADVEELGLESEPFLFPAGDKDPRIRLAEYGCSQDECAFIVKRRVTVRAKDGSEKEHWQGDRVELNALTSAQFVDWLERKLDLHGVKKVIPDDDVLDRRYREEIRERYIDKAVREARRTHPQDSEINVPDDLRDRVESRLEEDRSLPWGVAVAKSRATMSPRHPGSRGVAR